MSLTERSREADVSHIYGAGRIHRPKELAHKGALMSDERLQMAALDFRDLTTMEGRIFVHGEEQSSGRRYLMLERNGRERSLYLLHAGDECGAEYWRPEV